MNTNKEVEIFVKIHNELKDLLDKKDYDSTKNYLITLKNNFGDNIGALKTYLVITKSFKNHEDIKEIRQEIKDKLELILGRKLI